MLPGRSKHPWRSKSSSAASRPQKIAALFLADGHTEPFHDLKHVFPDLALLAQGLVAEQVGWMKRGHQRNAAIRFPVSPQSSDPFGLAEKSFDRGCAERNQSFRLDEVDLRVQVGNAGLHFLERRLAIAGGLPGRIRPALQNVPDVNGLAGQPHRLNDS